MLFWVFSFCEVSVAFSYFFFQWDKYIDLNQRLKQLQRKIIKLDKAIELHEREARVAHKNGDRDKVMAYLKGLNYCYRDRCYALEMVCELQRILRKPRTHNVSMDELISDEQNAERIATQNKNNYDPPSQMWNLFREFCGEETVSYIRSCQKTPNQNDSPSSIPTVVEVDDDDNNVQPAPPTRPVVESIQMTDHSTPKDRRAQSTTWGSVLFCGFF